MKYLLFLLLPFMSKAQMNTQIVGGTEALRTEAPWAVSLQANGYGHFCGGSLISPDTIITAAHCVTEGVDYVYIGMYSRLNPGAAEKHKVAKIIIHQRYAKNSHDFAILKLQTYSKIKPIELTTLEPLSGLVTVYGWGDTTEGGSMPNNLRKVTVPIVTRAQCKKSYPGQIDSTMICAGEKGKDSCQGDSGGALLYQGKLAGIVSWGEGCARPGKPGVYSNIALDLFWINAGISLK